MIHIDALWLATAPVDMRMGTERMLARVVQVFRSAQAHHGYLFANEREPPQTASVRWLWAVVWGASTGANAVPYERVGTDP